MSAGKSNFRAAVAVVLAVILMMGLAAFPGVAAEPETVVFVHTNDVHGHLGIEPYVKAVADSYKKQYGEKNVITASAGDVFAGGEPVAHMTHGESVVETMNAAGYDAMAIGNNDIPNGLKELMKHDEDTSFPILGANTAFNDKAGELGAEGELPFEPYKVFTTASGVKIGMFGLTTTGSPPAIDQDFYQKLPTIETAQKYVDVLKNDEKVDIVVALGHTGWPDNDPTMTAVTATDANSYQVAMAVEGIDLFIDGHTHSNIESEPGKGDGYVCDNESKTLIVQTGSLGEYIGVVTLTVDPETKTITGKNAMQIKEEAYKANYTPDAATLAIVEKWTNEINEKFGTVVGHTDYFLNGERTGSADGMGIRLAEQNLGNLVTDAIRDTTGADISFFSGVRIRASLNAGDITVKDLHGVFANGGTVVKVEMTGAEVKKRLADSVSSAAGGKESPGFAQVSGIRFVYDTDGEILSVTLEDDGSALEDDKTYIVAGELGRAPAGAETLYDGKDALVEMLSAYLASEQYDPSRYAGTLGRITRVEAAVYTDISAEDDVYDAAIYLQKQGLMIGVGDKQFAPDLELTRAMAVTVLYRLAGLPEVSAQETYSDVAADAWYYAAVNWAAAQGITIGNGDGTFGPDRALTDVEAEIFIARFEDLAAAEPQQGGQQGGGQQGGGRGPGGPGGQRVTELTLEEAAALLAAAESTEDNDVARNNYKTLAEIYLKGSDKEGYVQKDEDKALEYYLKAGEKGDALSYVNAGDIVRDRGEQETAIAYYELGSASGNPKGYRNIGDLYEKSGEYEKALEYYKKALELGDLSSNDYIGKLYEEGKLGEPDLETAAEYYLAGISKKNYTAGGINHALYRLGYFYENGLGGLEKNLGRAADMYTLASQNGNAEAGPALEAIYANAETISRGAFAVMLYSIIAGSDSI